MLHFHWIASILVWTSITTALTSIRDPFAFPEKNQKSLKQPTLLEGIVYAGQKRSAAVLVCGDNRQITQRGERFQGYQLVTIGKNFVVLVRGKKKQKLFIQ